MDKTRRDHTEGRLIAVIKSIERLVGSRTRRRRVIIGAGSCLIAVSIWAAAASSSSVKAADAASAATGAPTIAPGLAAAFPLLNNPPNAMPQIDVARIDNTDPSLGIDFSLARLAPISSGAPVWVIPGSAGVCLFVGNPNPVETPAAIGTMLCGTATQALAGQIAFTSTDSAGRRTTIGLAPSTNATGAPSVTIQDSNGSSYGASVSAGTYVVQDDAQSSVIVVGATGQPYAFPVPPTLPVHN